MDFVRFLVKVALVAGLVFLFLKVKDEVGGPGAAADRTPAVVAAVQEPPAPEPVRAQTPAAPPSGRAQEGVPVDADLALQQGMRAYRSGRDYARALQLLLPFAEQGNASAQLALGDMYHQGLGVARDDAAAYAWNRKAAEQGSAHARTVLGTMHQEGWGTPQDDARALALFRLAADQGWAPAQLALGQAYLNGRGLPKDETQAAAWLRKAADQGDNDAKVLLSQLKLP